MVFGEEILAEKIAEKGLGSLTDWFKKRQDKAEETKQILLALKIGLNNIILHMDLCKEFGHIRYSKFASYLPNDIEHINQLLIKYQSSLNNEIYEMINTFLKYLIEFNEIINSLTLGKGKEVQEFEASIRKSIEIFISGINKLIE